MERLKLYSNIDLKNGKILHLDGDRKYSEKSYKHYKKAGLNAIVKNIPEYKQPLLIKKYILDYSPDIIVITGHDSMLTPQKNYTNLSNYKNSKYFIKSILEARKLFPSINDLCIIAGACQSFFEALIGAGANFASSPARILIDYIDPLIVAEKIAITPNNKFININDIDKYLRNGKKGIDGIGSMGKRRL